MRKFGTVSGETKTCANGSNGDGSGDLRLQYRDTQNVGVFSTVDEDGPLGTRWVAITSAPLCPLP